MEKQLGQRLFHRTTRSVSPTDSGERLLRRIGPVIGDLDRALDEFGEDYKRVTGTLKINASDTAARVLFLRAVPKFLTQNPDASIELIVDRGFVDIIKQGFDAGVRFATAVPQDMIAVPFGDTVRFATVASPSYLQKRGTPLKPEDLQNHDCIRQRMPSGRVYRWQFEKHGKEIVVDVPGSLTLNNNELMAKAAAEGLGVAYLPERVVTTMLSSGALKLVLDEWMPPASKLCLYYADHRHVPASLRALIDILTSR